MSEYKSKTILLVEDEADIAMLEKIFLEENGFTVITAATGEKAVEIVESTPAIDLVLMDINLGRGIDGTEAAAIILKNHELPLVFLSSHTDPKVVEKTEKITSYGYIVKNSGETVLIASVKMAFRLFEAKLKEKEKTRQLQESEKRYRALIEYSNDVIFAVDGNGYYKYVNQVFASTFDKTPEYFEGKSFWDVYSKEQADIRHEAVTEVFKSGEVRSAEVDVPLPDRTLHFLATLNPVKDLQGNVITVLTHSKNITERKQVENALKESEEKLKEIFENSLDNIFVVDVFPYYRFKLKTINGMLEKVLKRDRKDVEGKFIDELFPKNIVDIIIEKYKRCVDSGEKYCYEEIAELLEEKTYYSTNLVPIFNETGKVFRIIGISRDISESKKAELALQESESKYRLLIEHSSDLIWNMTADTVITYASPSWKKVAGYSPESLVGLPFHPYVHPDDIIVYLNCLREMIQSKKSVSIPQYRIRHSDGSWHWYSANASPVLGQDGCFVSMVGISRDITERIQSEEKIGNLLLEKELILKEGHHRIKNNMNTIFTLLTVQSDAAENSSTRNALLDAAGRARSMMVLYDKLYRSEDNRTVSLKEYLPALVNEIAAIYSENSSLNVQVLADDIVLGVGLLSPLGIIIDELIANAVKHAFAGRAEKAITVKASKKEGRVSFVFKDNGSGLPESVTFKNSPGFGLQLVEILVKQINGSITIDRQNGTRFTVEFDA